MTREQKLSLILGFALVLVVGVLVSDHLSGARKVQLESTDPGTLIAANNEPVIDSPPNLILVNQDGKSILPPASTIAHNPGALAVPQPGPAGSGEALAQNPPSALDRLKEQFNDAVKELRAGDGVAAAQPNTAPVSLVDGPSTEKTVGGDSGPLLVPVISEARQKQPVNTPEYQLYTVKDGDTLWSISSKLLGDGSRHKALADYNKGRLTSDGGLRVGASLKIPTALMADPKLALKSAEPVEAPKTEGAAKPVDPKGTKSTPAPVKRQTPPTALTKADAPKGAENPKVGAPKPAPDKSKDALASKTATYTVKAGDTLQKIAAKTMGSSKRADELAEANASVLDDEDTLTVGQQLKIPAR